MTYYIISCQSCKHYKTQRKCKAFPKEIPDEIWYGKNDHKQKVRGDNGIQYESIKSSPQMGGIVTRPIKLFGQE